MSVAVASIIQESNTFAARTTSIRDFDISVGDSAAIRLVETNSEMAGVIEELRAHGVAAVPLMHAWALPGGPVEEEAFDELLERLVTSLGRRSWDAVVVSVHGAMATTERDDADGDLLDTVRDVVGDVPLFATVDLHANMTSRMVASVDAVVAYHSDPHVDQAETGRRAAQLAAGAMAGRIRPVTRLAKIPMIVPAESMNTNSGPLAEIRRVIDAELDPGVLDVSLLPSQPWLDVGELGFGVLVTTDDDAGLATELALRIAGEIWERREEFSVDLVSPEAAVSAARRARNRPFIIAESADAPTAGGAGDSPVMVESLLRWGDDLAAYVPVVDPEGVALCHAAGLGAAVSARVGAGIDRRWWKPVPVAGRVAALGDGAYRLQGRGYTGLEVSMGRFAVLSVGRLRLLLSERPAWAADPATFLHAGLDPAAADVVVVRSCSDFLPNYPDSESITLDVPGAATPRLESLRFRRAPRPLWPLDRHAWTG